MLSSSSSHRLLSLLTHAIHSCKEEERKLEEQLRKYRKLLCDWKTDCCEALNEDESEREAQESKPSQEEVKEVELLNKALEKALKVRGGLKPELPKTPSSMQTMATNATSQDKPVKPLQVVVNTGTKPKTYQLKPPYKTMPEKRLVKGSARPVSTATMSKPPPRPISSANDGKNRVLSSANTSRSPPSIPLTSEKGNSGKYRVPPTTNTSISPPSIPLTSEKGNSGKDWPPSTSNSAKSPPLRPLPSEKSQDRPSESKKIPPRADGTQANVQTSSAPDMECVSSILTATDVKTSKQDQRQRQALTLKDVGPTLNLPVKYQQLYKKNSRLWEKYFELGGRVPAPRPSFIQQLQTTFIPGSPELSLLEIEEEMLHLQRAVRRLEEYIDAAKTWQGSGPAHWQHYRTLLMLEAMQDEVAKSHCELQKLRLVAEQYKKWCEKLSINLDCSEVAGCPTEFCALPSVLVYSHPDELHQLTATHLRVRELQQKIHLQKVLSHELLEEEDLQCRSTSPSYMLLRAIYTQLCEGGDTFPVLVHDDS